LVALCSEQFVKSAGNALFSVMVSGIEVTLALVLEPVPSSVRMAKSAFCVPAFTLGIVLTMMPRFPEVMPVVVTPEVIVAVGVPARNAKVVPDAAVELTLQLTVIVVVAPVTISGVSNVKMFVPLPMVFTLLLPVVSAVPPLDMSWQAVRSAVDAPAPGVTVIGIEVIEYVLPLLAESMIVPKFVAVAPGVMPVVD
jgi:hypothetical protein